jgi:hypothetical protein
VRAGRPAHNLRGSLAHCRVHANPPKWVALPTAWELYRGELRDATHPARATLTRAPGGITLGREEGELDTVFTYLGRTGGTNESCQRAAVRQS